MAILNIQTSQAGEAGVLPSYASILTSDTEAAVLTAGYLNQAVQNGASFALPCIAKISTKASSTADYQVGWYQITHVGTNWSAVPAGSPGDVVLPTVANQIVHATNATGTLSTDAANVINLGNITAGSSAVAGSLTSFAGTGSTEFLRLAAINNTGGNFSTTISNIASVGQSQTISIPDVGAATGNFILSGLVSGGTQHITLGALQVDAGVISSGISTGGTAGGFIAYPATTTNGSLRLVPVGNVGNFAATISNIVGLGQATVYTIPDPGAATATFILSASAGGQSVSGGFTVSTGNLAVSAGTITASGAITSTAGNITSGSSGDAGTFISFPATAANGTLILAAVNAGGAFDTTISSGTIGQSSVFTIPDPGAATANFLVDAGAANILAQQEFVSINEVLTFGTGTWTTTRIAQGNYVKRHTPADETSIVAVDITPAIRVAASKGFRLDSFDIIYAIAANALDAHSAVLDRIAYANNVAVSVTSVPITATLATATQANPYVTNCTVTTPAFDITADSKYVLELTVNNAAASEYDYYGVMLRFSQTIG